MGIARNLRRLARKQDAAAAKKPQRKAMMEPMEPRLLLSADDLLPGIGVAMPDGLDALGAVVQDFVDQEPLLDTYVPGVLRYNESPTVQDLLAIETDLNRDGDRTDTGEATLNGLDQYELVSVSPLQFAKDGKVDFEEFFNAYVTDEISAFLDEYTPANPDDLDDPLNLPTFQTDFATFLNNNLDGSALFSSTVGNLEVYEGINIAVDNIDIDGDGFTSSVLEDGASFDVSFALTFWHKYPINLGEQASDLMIQDLPTVYTWVGSTVALDFILGFDNVDSEFYIEVPEVGKLSIAVDTYQDTLSQFTMNVGFLETWAAYETANDDFSIDMLIETSVHDPSDPDALGFDTLPNASGNTDPGTIVADFSIEDLTEPDNFTLKYDVIFTLEIGNNDQIAPVEIVLQAENTNGSNADTGSGGGDANTSLEDLLDDIRYAIEDASPALADIITVADDGAGKITLSVPSQSDLLGFNNDGTGEAYASDGDNDGEVVLTASAVPAGYEFASDISFLLSVNGQLPYVITLPATDTAIEELGFAPSEQAELLPLAAENTGPTTGQFSTPGDKSFDIIVTIGTSEYTATVTLPQTAPGWSDNTSLSDLVQDINDAMAAVSWPYGFSEYWSSHVVAQLSSDGTRIELAATDTTINSIAISDLDGDAAETGFVNGQMITLSVTTDTDASTVALTVDATIDIVVVPTFGAEETFTITVPAGTESAGFVSAINDALSDAGIGGSLEAVAEGVRITLKVKADAADDIESFDVVIPKVTKGNTSAEDLAADINRVLADIGGTHVAAGTVVGGRLTLTHFGTAGDPPETLEVTRKLTLDADNRITGAELEAVDSEDLFPDPAADPDSRFYMNLGVKAKTGADAGEGEIWDVSSDSDPDNWVYYEPSAVLKADFNPFVEGATTLVNVEGYDKLSFLITDEFNTPLVESLRETATFIIAGDAAPGDGQLTADATFDISIDDGTAVTVLAADTTDNALPEDLADDINDAIAGTDLDGLIQAFVYSPVGGAQFIMLKTLGDATEKKIEISAGAEEIGFVEDQSSDVAFDDLLDFNVITAQDVASLIIQLRAWLDRLPETALLNNTDIPFARAVLGDLLDFGDIIDDELLINDGDDGLQKPSETTETPHIDDIAKILGYDSEENLTVRYITAQDLAYLMAELNLLTGTKPVRYDPATKHLTYDLSLEHTFTTVIAPIDLGIDLDPLSSLYSESQVALYATGYFDATMGFVMGANVGNIDYDTTLDYLDITIKDTLALTGAEDVLKVYGRLTADAIFDVVIIPESGSPVQATVTVYKSDPDDTGDLTGTDDNLDADDLILDLNNALAHALNATASAPSVVGSEISSFELSTGASFDVAINGSAIPVTVTVTVGATAGNETLADFVADINAALSASGVNIIAEAITVSEMDVIRLMAADNSVLKFSITAAADNPFGFAEGTTDSNDRTIDLSQYLTATLVNGRIQLNAADGVDGFSVSSATNNTAFTELGIRPNTAYTVEMTGTAVSDVTPGDLDFKIYVNGSATETLVEVRNTAGNATLTDLVLDINQAIALTDLYGKIVAGRYGQQIILAAIDASVEVFKVTDASDLGFTNGQVAGVWLLGAQNIGHSPDGEISATAIYGQLTGDAHFTITFNDDDTGTLVTVTEADTVDNQSLSDLVDVINAALTTAGINDKILAELNGSKLQFRAIDDSVKTFTIDVPDDDPAETDLGLVDGTTAEAVLAVTSSTNVPFYYGPAADATFKVSINDGSSETTYQVSLSMAGALDNRTMYSLVQDLNAALKTAVVLDSGGNPTAVTADLTGMVKFDKDGARLVLDQIDTTLVAFSVIADVNDPSVTDLKLWDVTTDLTGLETSTFNANMADLLIRTSDGKYHAVTLDGATDIQGVLDAINGLGGDPVFADLNYKKIGINLVDNGFDPSNTEMFNVATVNRSSAALALGIFGSDMTTVDLSEGKTADGLIEGSRLSPEKLGDRFFLAPLEADRPFLSASVWVGNPLDTPVSNDIAVTGNFGFVEVMLTQSGNEALYSADFDIKLADNEGVFLRDMFLALGDADGDDVPGQLSDLLTAVDLPTFELAPINITEEKVESFNLTTDESFFVYAYSDIPLLGFTDGQEGTGAITAAASPPDFSPGTDVTLLLTLNGVNYVINVPKSATDGNASIDGLVADLNTALKNAKDDTWATVDLTSTVTAEKVLTIFGTKLKITATDESTSLGIYRGTWRYTVPLYGEPSVIGFEDGASATDTLTASETPTLQTGSTISFLLTIAGTDSYTIRIHNLDLIGEPIPINDLVTDLNSALASAVAADGSTVNLTTLVYAEKDASETKLQLKAIVDEDEHLTLTINSLGVTADNTTMADYVDDINDALETAGLVGGIKIEASDYHGHLRLIGSGENLTSFSIDASASETSLGTWSYSTDSNFILDIAVLPAFEWADSSPLDAGDGKLAIIMNDLGNPFADPPYLVADHTPDGFILTSDATFKVSVNSDTPVTVRVRAADTVDNTDLDGLIADINTALGRYSNLAGRIIAVADGNYIRFEAANASVDTFTITTPAGNELGLDAVQESFDPGAPTATVTSSNLTDLTELGDLGFLGDVDFSLVLAALRKGAEFLEQFGDLPFLDDELPFLGESINSYLDLAGRFRQALTAIEQNPSASIQDLDQAIRQAFGLPIDDPATVVNEVIQFYQKLGLADTTTTPVGLQIVNVDGHKFLQVALRLPVGYVDDNLPVNLDLGVFEVGGENLFLQGDTGLGARAYLDARIGLGIDLEDHHIVLFESDSNGVAITGITGDFVVTSGSDPLNFGINIDTRGLTVRDGVIDIDLDIGLGNMMGPFPANEYIDDLSNMTDVFNGFEKIFDVPAFEVILPVYNFDASEFIGEIGLDATGLDLDAGFNLDLSGIDPLAIADEIMELDFENFNIFENLFSMIDGLDDFLATVQGILDGEVFGFQLPFIGDQLAAGADFIETVRRGIITPFEEFIQETPDLVKEMIRDFLFAILGPGGDNVASIPDNIPGLGLLVNYDLVGGDIDPLDDVGTGDYSETQIAAAMKLIGDGTNSVEWKFRLGDSFQPDFNVDFDMGWPALNFDLDADLLVNIDWSFVTGIGISLENGVFFDVSAEDDLTVDLGVEIATGSTMTGTLGFLQLEVKAVDTNFDNNLDDDPNNIGPDPNRFEAGFTVDLTETGSDGLIKFSELTSKLDIGIGMSAGAELNLDLEVKFNEAILPDTISALLPSITTQFVLDWNPDPIENLLGGAEFNIFGDGLDLLAFYDVTIDMGSFIGDLLGPVVDKIQEITEPVQPIIDVLTAPIPVLSDLAGRDITLIDIAEMMGYIDAGMIYAIADLITFVNSIPAEPGFLGINLGDFVLIGEGSTSDLTGSSLTDPNFDLTDDGSFDLKSALPAGFVDTLEGFSGLLDSNTEGDAASKSTMQDLISTGGAGGDDGYGFAFPILENPSQIFGLLLGRPAALITYDLPPFGMEFTWDMSFPIYPPLYANVGVTFGVTIDFAFGYDTEGIARFIEGDCENPLDLLAGFFVSDTDLPEGTGGTDVPELTLLGEIAVGAELNLGIASAGVEAAIGLRVNFDLYDPDHDGRVRIDELVSTFMYELECGNPAKAPMAIFDISGDIYFQLRAFLNILMLELEFEITPKIVLFEFKIPFERAPILGTERADALLLNMGPNSESRLNGDTSDTSESMSVIYEGGGSWSVYSGQFNVSSGGAQPYDGDRLIVYGGEGNDVVDVDLGGCTSPVDIEFYGGPGDDTLNVHNGQANVLFYGGIGNDTVTIDTTGGANVLYGEEGADTITVTGASSSTVFGDNGILRINRDTGLRDKAIGWARTDEDGIDTISTGDGNDVVFGGGFADIIKTGAGNDLAIGDGGYFTFVNGDVPHNSPSVNIDAITLYMGTGGNDVIFGGAGMDALFGGPGDDILDGGADDDQVLGGEGADILYGGGGSDDIYGEKGRDTIFGFRDPQAAPGKSDDSDLTAATADGGDLIYGGDHQDYVRGNAGNDVIYGDQADDILFGDEGNDLIYGSLGSDLIFGGAGSDIIDGSEGSDVVFGDDGLVAYVNYDDSLPEWDYTGSLIRITADGHRLIGDAPTQSLLDVLDAGFTPDDDPLSPDIYLTAVAATDGNDVVAGGAGNDIVLGGAGNDWVGGDVPLFKTYTDRTGTIDTNIYVYDADPMKNGRPVIVTSTGGAAAIDLGGGNYLLLTTALPADSDPPGEDVMLGDSGRIEFYGRRYSRILSLPEDPIPGAFYADTLVGDNGEDIGFGGTGNDTVYGGHRPALGAVPQSLDNEGAPIFDANGDAVYNDNDILLGDNGVVEFYVSANQVERIYTSDTVETTGGADTIDGLEGDDVILGGVNNDDGSGDPERDTLFGNVGHDAILGDNGLLDFADEPIALTAEADAALTLPEAVIIKIRINEDDPVYVTVTAGTYADTEALAVAVNEGLTDASLDTLILAEADGNRISMTATDATVEKFIVTARIGNELGFGTKQTGPDLTTLDLVKSDINGLGGADTISGNAGNDTVMGGTGADTIYGDDAAASANDKDYGDILIGDSGAIRLGGHVPGRLTVMGSSVVFIHTTDETNATGGGDTISGNADVDVVIGGVSNGETDTLYGDAATPKTLYDSDDVLIGDNGLLHFAFGTDTDLTTLDIVATRAYKISEASILDWSFQTFTEDDTVILGGNDVISGNAGCDTAFGGVGSDIVYGDNAAANSGASDSDDILFGDNGSIELIGTTGRLIVLSTAVDLITTTDTEESTGGADTMSGNAGNDVMLGGVNNDDSLGDPEVDTLYGDREFPDATTIANDVDDIMLGDNGLLDFTFETDTDRMTLDLIHSFEDGFGGTDIISGNKGMDVAIGGTGGDFIYGDAETLAQLSGADDLADLLLGDNADIFLLAAPAMPVAGFDLKLVLDAAVFLIRTTDTVDPIHTGGADTISGNAKGDIIAGGVFGDIIYGDREAPDATTEANEGDDIILGDNGAFEWLSEGRLDEVTGIDIEANNPDLYDWFYDLTDPENPIPMSDTDLSTLDLVTTEQPTSGGRDTIYGDNGRDLVFGGTDADTIYGDDGTLDEIADSSNNDLLLGDHGRIYPQFSTLREEGQDWREAFNSRNFFAIDIGDVDGGEGDRMWGEEGDDTMLGQQGDDRMFGGSGDDDMTGGHNVSSGIDELTVTTILASLDGAGIAVPAIDDVNDLMDGGTGDDSMAGDNAIIWRRGDDFSPRFRELTGDAIYSTTNSTIIANIGGDWQSDPADAIGRDIELVDHSDTTMSGLYGSDVMAGGADSDTMFGQLANDLMQGDGYIGADDGDAGTITYRIDIDDSTDPLVNPPDTDETLYFNIPEAASDGDDYLEGNGGSDLMYGGLGQDDMIGGSSELFGLVTEAMRPDDSDFIFGGAGIDTDRNDIGDATLADGSDPDIPENTVLALPGGHVRDADFIMGDNANVYRLVNAATDEFLTFNYDTYAPDTDPNTYDHIIPRAMEQLDYTLGGADYYGGAYINGAAELTGQPADNGAADLIHGESGDDIIFGMTGSDVIFGEGQDDDIVGGYGNDWISGGTGQDGVLGDDGLVLTSRNSTTGEPLYGVAGLAAKDSRPKYADGDVLNEIIYTPGSIQYAVINVEGQLKKSIDLVPFSYDPDWIAIDDEFPDNQDNQPYADDIIFGGLGSDWLHGGSGDDAISGAEALEHAYVPVNFTLVDDVLTPTDILDLGYDMAGVPANLLSMNPGDALAFNPMDTDGQHLNNRYRAGEFFLYDEYDPRLKIMLDSDGNLWKSSDQGTAYEFLLNFDETEGVVRPAGEVPKATGQQTETYPQVWDDGRDAIFGDLGNDWLVGGTGADDLYGGWGNDLLNADDDHTTLGEDGVTVGANDLPDTHPFYQDRAYGGAGRDILIGNTGGDRLIDWVGEYNSYLVPYAPFGQASVSRTLQPFLPEFLYALSAGDGADFTRMGDEARNGEPEAEMGLVLQKDFAWQDQTGAPADPQAGNIPGGARDVLRSAGFNDGTSDDFFVDSGVWSVVSGRYQVAPTALGGDALSVFFVNEFIPNYFEMMATIQAVKPIAGYNANAYLVFDYQSSEDFKFAGINVSTSKLEIGYRDALGWHVVVQAPYTGALRADTDYNVFLSLNGNTAILVVNNRISLTYTFESTYGTFLNDGMVGLGANNAKAQIDNVVVQRIPPAMTYTQTVDFSDQADVDSLFQDVLTIDGGLHTLTADPGGTAVDLVNMQVAPASVLSLEAILKTSYQGGFVFDYYGPEDFKYVAVSVETGKVLVGHSTSRAGVAFDAEWSATLSAGTNYTLGITIAERSVSVTLNEMPALSYAFNALITDGEFGLLAQDGAVDFDEFTVRTDDPAYSTPALPTLSVSDASVNEGDGTVSVTVTLSAPSDKDVLVSYTTVDGTAVAGDDYTSATGTLTFAVGETSQQLVFNIIGDDSIETDEVFSVQLFNSENAIIGDGVGNIAIVDDDGVASSPTLSISDVIVLEGAKTNKTKVNITVTLSAPSADSVIVHLATQDGTANSGYDYVPVADAAITFAPGETVKQYTLTINGDKVWEPDETFNVLLSNAEGATIADGFGEVTILNDDPAPLLAAETATGPQSKVELLTDEQLNPIVDEAITRWEAALGAPVDLGGIDFQIMDFEGRGRGILGQTTPDMIYIDADAAGWGWYVDQTPDDDTDDGNLEDRMDLLTAVMHEIGHALGYGDLSADSDDLMSAALDAGERLTLDGGSLVVMDTSYLGDDDPPDPAATAMEKNFWLREFLITRAQGERNPFEPTEKFQIVITDEETEEA